MATVIDDMEICTRCGKETDDITVIDDETRVCSHCLENFDLCDVCGEYYDSDWVDIHHLDDGRTVCDNCIDSISEESEDEE